MKNYKVLSLSMAAAATLMATSCTNSDYLDINQNPNYPSQASELALFPSAEASTISILGLYGQITGNFWCQYYTQGNSTNQYNTVSVYQVTTGSGTPPCTGLWVNSYANALEDLKLTMAAAKENKNYNYYLAAEILMAYNYLMLTDSYGDIPFTQALNIDEFKSPAFDSSKDVVYPGILAMLDDALKYENEPVLTELNDFFFDGSVSKWCQFARSLKLKMYLKDVNANKSAIENLLKDTGALLQDDCAWTSWEDSNNHGNPFYEYNIRQLNTTENVRACHTLLEFLKKNNDPRAIVLYNPISSSKYSVSGSAMSGLKFKYGQEAVTVNEVFEKMNTIYDGIPFGGSSAINTTVYPISKSSRARQAYDDPVYLMNKSEALLMIAEAYYHIGNDAKAKDFYDDAVKAGLNRWADIAALVKSGDVEDFVNGAYAYDGTIECIARQYWLTYAGANAYDGWLTRNRLGYPEIQANIQVVSEKFYEDATAEHALSEGYNLGSLVDPVATVLQPGQYPARLLYPTNTTMYNTSALDYVNKNGNDLLKKLWWQK